MEKIHQEKELPESVCVEGAAVKCHQESDLPAEV